MYGINTSGADMNKIITYYCKYCKRDTRMRVSEPIKVHDYYWLHCMRCQNNWRVSIKELEKKYK